MEFVFSSLMGFSFHLFNIVLWFGFGLGLSSLQTPNSSSEGASKFEFELLTSKCCGVKGGFDTAHAATRACNKAVVECNVPTTDMILTPGSFDGNFSLPNNHQEFANTHHNLDLGLWISPPSNIQRGNNIVRNTRLNDASYHLSGANKDQVSRV